MRELLRAMNMPIPANVLEVSDGLQYRDFITVGLLADRLKVKEPDGGLLKDTWIYIQEPDVLLGRLQIFNNWSPYLVAIPPRSGSASNTSATTPTICGRWPTTT